MARLEVPKAIVGIVIATLVLLPEGLAAVRAAQSNRLQTSLEPGIGFRARDAELDGRAHKHRTATLSETPLWLGIGEDRIDLWCP
jgi:hypothetical protein